MLELRSWLPLAEALELGRSQRVSHDCGEGTPLIVEHKEEGWSAWCHRCNDKGWKPKPKPTLAERMARRQAQRAAEQALVVSPRLPYPQQYDVQQWPLEARVWLYKAGLFNEDIKKLGAYFHETTQRVVLKVPRGDQYYWQARNVGLCPERNAPKYINCRVPKDGLVYSQGYGPEVVLVEDILSAYRVGLHTEAWSLLGTQLHDRVLAQLVTAGKPVLVWLDDDTHYPNNPGQSAARKIMRSLELAGVTCRNIKTELDPKLLSRREVIETINETRNTL